MAIECNEGRACKEFVNDKIIEMRPATVLEVGCSSSCSFRRAAEILPATKFYGIDIMQNSIAKGRKENLLQNIFLSVMDACRMDQFSDEMFDIIKSDHMIEHLDVADQLRFLNEVWRVLKRGGVFFVSTPNVDALALIGTKGLQKDHLHELNLYDLLWLGEECGFKAEKIYGQGIVKRRSRIRSVLNFAKKLDKYNVRRFCRKTVDFADRITCPVNTSDEVQEISRDTISSNMLVQFRK